MEGCGIDHADRGATKCVNRPAVIAPERELPRVPPALRSMPGDGLAAASSDTSSDETFSSGAASCQQQQQQIIIIITTTIIIIIIW
jgi:hypothetical protein